MKSYIGIIAAEDEEVNAVKNIMKNITESKLFNLNIISGQIQNKDCVLVKCGVGKVNAARTTQILIDNFDIEYIINVGSGAGLNSSLKIGDIVIGNKLVQHDFDVTPFNREKGEIPETGRFFECNKILIEKCKDISIDNINIVFGTIASGDIFCTDIAMKDKIKAKFDADCLEMEGASIAQVCCLDNIPFIVIRSISDIPNGNNTIDFNEYLKLASKNCANFILKLFSLI